MNTEHKKSVPIFLDQSLAKGFDEKARAVGMSKNETVSRYLELGVAAVDRGECERISPVIRGLKKDEASPSDARIEESKNLFAKS